MLSLSKHDIGIILRQAQDDRIRAQDDSNESSGLTYSLTKGDQKEMSWSALRRAQDRLVESMTLVSSFDKLRMTFEKAQDDRIGAQDDRIGAQGDFVGCHGEPVEP